MAVLGIITCQILELEFADLLSHDRELGAVAVLDNGCEGGLIDAMEQAGGIKPRRISALEDFAPSVQEGVEALVCVMELGLHLVIKRLQQTVVKMAGEIGPYVDAILLGYGLCGNALNNPEELLAEVGVPIIIPMDDDHPVDDCVGLIIGGRENYYAEQCKVAGTMFMTAGFSRHWKDLMRKGQGGRFDWEISKRLLAHYERNLLLPTPVLSEEQMRENIEEFNRVHGFRNEVRPGALDILQDAWERAKKTLPLHS